MNNLKAIGGVAGTLLIAIWLIVLGALATQGLAAEVPPTRYKAELILEIRDEKLRIFQYETRTLICHISIIDVQMIGAQASVSCVRKDERNAPDSRGLPR